MLVGAAALAALAVAAASSSQAQEGTDLWLIYDGPGAGTTVATPSGQSAVRSTGPQARPQNAVVQANGVVSTQPHDRCGQLHYHGNLHGDGDPDQQGCGWGRVIKLADASRELTLLSTSYMAEVEALNHANAPTPDYHAANRLLTGSDDALEELRTIVSFRFTPGQVTEWLKAVLDPAAVASDLIDQLARGSRGNRGAFQRARALEKMGEAIAAKRALTRALVASGTLNKESSGCEDDDDDDDYRSLAGAVATIRGTPRADLLCGTAGPDRIDGRGGNDRIVGAGGNDVLSGGPGNDMIAGGAGADRINGGPGRDSIASGSGRDNVNGGPGNDTIRSGEGADRAAGGAGTDTIDGRRRP